MILDRLAWMVARGIHHGFETYYDGFKDIMRRSRQRFEGRDWAGLQIDADHRLTLYARAVETTVAYVEDVMAAHVHDPDLWELLRETFELLSTDPATGDLARAYFSTIKRRFIPVDASDFEPTRFGVLGFADPKTGVQHQEQFVEEVWLLEPPEGPKPVETLLRRIVELHAFDTPYINRDEDLRQAAMLIEDRLTQTHNQRVAVLKPLFYRGKRAHIVGRIWSSGRFIPLVIAITNLEDGLRIAEVLLGNEETSSLFSFTRSQFHVVTAHHRELMGFLRSLAPAKSPADLYASVGYHNLSKSALLADLFRLVQTGERFRRTSGVNGTVMLVFELPGSRFVIKVIRDRFLARRVETTREKVMRRYRFVQHVERAGRILDIFHFHHVRFDRAWFDGGLLEELITSVPSKVSVEGESVILQEFYAQRKVVPLELFLRGPSDPALKRRAVIDFGFLHKELASRNIFTGDVVANNFGVVSLGRFNMRVVSFDYDGYSRVTDLTFLSSSLRSSDQPGEDASPWSVYDDWNASEDRMVIDEEWDVIPEKFQMTFGIPETFREEFDRVHSELYSPAYWIALKEKLRDRPEDVEAFPYHLIGR